MRARIFLVLAALFLATTSQAGPMVHHIEFVTPRAGERGKTVDVTIEGAYIKDAREILFYRPGIKCIDIQSSSLKEPRSTIHSGFVQDTVRARFEIAPDCPVGVHPFKLRTATELSTLSTFVVAPFPVRDEDENGRGGNDTIATATPAALNTSVRGRIDSAQVADVDAYRVACQAGEHLSVEVDAVGLAEKHYGGSEYDLLARLLDAEGHEIARNDDNGLHLQDPIISTIVPRAGDYFVEIKQRVFNSGAQSSGGQYFYLANIGNNARPLAAYPAGGRAGQNLQTTLLGDPSGKIQKTVALPNNSGDFDYREDWPSPLPLRVSQYDNVLENRAAEETPVPTLPTALNGIIEAPGDVDAFRVPAKKGDRWRVIVYARSLGTPLDPRLTIRRVGAENDEVTADDASLEARGLYALSGQIQRKEKLDPAFIWEPKEDGDYLLSITDMRGMGDALSVYRVEIEAPRDEIDTFIAARVIDSVECPRITSIAVPQGNRWTVNVNLAEGLGNRYKGSLDLVASGLPQGVSMIAPRIVPGLKQFPVQFVAAPDAHPQVALISLQVKAADGSPLVSNCQQSFPFLNHSGGHAWETIVADKFALAVTEAAPYSVELLQPQISLSQNGELALPVKITRRAGFDEPIEFQCDWTPNGIKSDPTVTIPAGESEGILRVSADSGTPPASWQLAVTASTTGGSYYLGAGRTRASSNFVNLTVAEPYVLLKNHPAAVRCGAAAQVVWDIENKKPFEGEAEAILLGLPKGVTVKTNPKIKTGDTQLVFEISATGEALLGQYKELTCEIIVKEKGQEIRQRSGKGILRVDPALTTVATAEKVATP